MTTNDKEILRNLPAGAAVLERNLDDSKWENNGGFIDRVEIMACASQFGGPWLRVWIRYPDGRIVWCDSRLIMLRY